MQRLTEKTKDCFGYRLKDGSDAEVGFFKDYDAFFSHKMVVKALGEYEDLEEQGLLLRLPCKVGDTVYSIEEKSKKQGRKKVAIQFIEQREVDSISVGFSGVPVVTVCNNENGWEIFYDNDFGKTVFFTKEEAEAKLKELEGSEEE